MTEPSAARRIINPWTWQDRLGFAQAVEARVERVLYCAGQTSVDADGAVLHAGDIGAQLMQSLDNLERVLRDADRTLADVVRLNVFTTDVDGLFSRYEPFVERLSAAGCRPATTLLGVTRLASPELLVEIEATAAT